MLDAICALALDIGQTHAPALCAGTLSIAASFLAKPALRSASRSMAQRAERRRLAVILEEQSLSEWLGSGFVHPAHREMHFARASKPAIQEPCVAFSDALESNSEAVAANG